MGDPVYLDTSALVKLIVQEDHSDEVGRYLDDPACQAVSSEITEVELLRAINRQDSQLMNRGLEVLAQTVLLPLTTSMKLRATYLDPTTLRSLDAIHVATALEIQTDLECLVSYDHRLLESASAAGLRVMSPGMNAE